MICILSTQAQVGTWCSSTTVCTPKICSVNWKRNTANAFIWIGLECTGFNNTYGLVVRREIAAAVSSANYSDLRSVAGSLTFGAEYDFFEREDGYDALCETYGLNFGKTMDLDIGLKYQAINQGQIDVMVIFTTDGQLSASDVVVLEDDKHFYPSYVCGNVVRQEVLEQYPELEAVLKSQWTDYRQRLAANELCRRNRKQGA